MDIGKNLTINALQHTPVAMKTQCIAKMFVSVVAICGLASCTINRTKYVPKLQSGQKKISIRGGEAVLSKKKNTITIVVPTKEYPEKSTQVSSRIMTAIEIFNGSKRDFDVSTNDVSLFADGVPIKIYTKDKRESQLRSKAAMNAAIAAAFGAATNQVYVNKGHYNMAYNNTADTARFLNQTDRNLSIETRLLKLNYFSDRHTILKSRSYGGQIVSESAKGLNKELVFTIKVGDEVHVFKFEGVTEEHRR
ncbi:hypothetical protein N9Z15_04765 [Akkermansiaceae bacterium]|nr:hypothetical protein [Akkermansiaceae bacterium]MDB4412621.1 hypothetical protein [bacterium]